MNGVKIVACVMVGLALLFGLLNEGFKLDFLPEQPVKWAVVEDSKVYNLARSAIDDKTPPADVDMKHRAELLLTIKKDDNQRRSLYTILTKKCEKNYYALKEHELTTRPLQSETERKMTVSPQDTRLRALSEQLKECKRNISEDPLVKRVVNKLSGLRDETRAMQTLISVRDVAVKTSARQLTDLYLGQYSQGKYELVLDSRSKILLNDNGTSINITDGVINLMRASGELR